jgi:hypothetical protein
MEQPVAPEQTGVRESLVTNITCHPLSDVLHCVVKLEAILGTETAGAHLAVIWFHL